MKKKQYDTLYTKYIYVLQDEQPILINLSQLD